MHSLKHLLKVIAFAIARYIAPIFLIVCIYKYDSFGNDYVIKMLAAAAMIFVSIIIDVSTSKLKYIRELDTITSQMSNKLKDSDN
jgi:hypothetical protein